ncbi:hypothetical protein HYH03_013883 [Edaphochlamys debaryana]|uniref:Fungal lipase-type domain-containing protein n=1 Tax=Edaphochlamys debaryana TaxID=47281 RepID=A0A835XV67_9CHLO|nr:hypothetical protein HYH03_013883 [Edaphochlamys debaryana]|eukprot:KAG2487460.1 hypothetical protein HYH03_013883 [Edaphochlamys debaryana]
MIPSTAAPPVASSTSSEELAPIETEGVKVVKGWRKGPYNRLQDPLPYHTIVAPPASPPSTVASTPSAASAEAKAAAATAALAAADGYAAPPKEDASKPLTHAPSLRHTRGLGGSARRPKLSTVLNVHSYLEPGEGSSPPVPPPKLPLVTEDELLALPFRPPRVWGYVLDIATGTWELVLYVLVMLLAIMLESNARYFRSGSDFDRWWVVMYKVAVIFYPAGIMVLQFGLLVEYTFRKYLYFRLLSFRIMVITERRQIWRSWYFVLFMAIYVILNVWAWWGVIAWWGRNGKEGPEVLSFAVFGVVNVVAFHLLIYYRRLVDEEKHHMKPLQAYLLGDMTLVSEAAVMQEAWRLLRAQLFGYCWPGPKRLDVGWLRAQGVPLSRAAVAAGAAAAVAAGAVAGAAADGGVRTAEALEEAAAAAGIKASARYGPHTDPHHLGEGEEEGDSDAHATSSGSSGGAQAGAAAVDAKGAAEVAPLPAAGMARDSFVSATSRAPPSSSDSSGALPTPRAAAPVLATILSEPAPDPAAGPAPTGPCGPGPVAEGTEEAPVPVSKAAAVHPSDINVTATDGAAVAADGAALPRKQSSASSAGAAASSAGAAASAAGASASAAGAAAWGCCRRGLVCCFRCYCACCCWGWRLLNPKNYNDAVYASPMAFLGAFSWHRTWPFPRDVKVLRALWLTVFLATLLVAGAVVYGVWLAVRSPPVCQWGLDACYDCTLYQEEYVQYDKVCTDGGYNITKTWPDPDYVDPNCPSGRSWFTNGVWSHNATLALAQREPYQPIAGQPLVNGYLAGAMAYYAYADGFEGLLKGFEGQYTKRFKELFGRYGMTDFEFVFIDDAAIEDTQFVVAGTGRDVYMIFRGTDGATDTFITDLAGTCKANSDFGADSCAHSGFLHAYRTAQPQVYAALIALISRLNATRTPDGRPWAPRSDQPQPFSLWLTGHSLGGALATLCAADLANKGLYISGVYTFGSPRVGDDRFRSRYAGLGLAEHTWRFTHRSDAITMVPPEVMGFTHVVPPTMLMDGKCTAWPESTCAAGGIWGGCAMSGADHLVPGYLANLRSCVAASNQLPDCTEAMLPLWEQMGRANT